MKPLIQKKYLKLYEENAITREYNLLFKYPEKEFSLSDIAREAGVAKANLGKILDELFKLEYNTINLKELSVFEEYIHRNIQIHLFNRENINSNLFSNLVNGIILYGFLEVNNE